MRQLRERPLLDGALAAGDITGSLAFEIAGWTRTLPAAMREETDRILLQAHAAGASLDDLATIAACAIERWRQQQPDPGQPDDGFDDRYLQVGTTFGGEAKERQARAGKRSGGGSLWFGYVRVYANPDEPVARKRVILREELHSVNAPALRAAAERVLRGESVGSIIREWDALGIRPVAAREWSRASFTGTLTSPRIAGLLAWQGQKFPTTDWPAIIDVDTHEQLACSCSAAVGDVPVDLVSVDLLARAQVDLGMP